MPNILVVSSCFLILLLTKKMWLEQSEENVSLENKASTSKVRGNVTFIGEMPLSLFFIVP